METQVVLSTRQSPHWPSEKALYDQHGSEEKLHWPEIDATKYCDDRLWLQPAAPFHPKTKQKRKPQNSSVSPPNEIDASSSALELKLENMFRLLFFDLCFKGRTSLKFTADARGRILSLCVPRSILFSIFISGTRFTMILGVSFCYASIPIRRVMQIDSPPHLHK